ncbi:elongation of fatty acids protein 3-like [Gastrolobium bilobum]|uniref:elongation of fatty acids protein 3-like n=1 Tax=Gastrolobium bilobum TaxID=150636 RepID=UPI002AB06478|nr:elongation of fatty acids protein 3-like [Gastrolobium bilobum]
MRFQVIQPLKYLLLDHPNIVWFRWSPTQSWGATWSFLVTAIVAYITAALTLHLILKICRRRRAIPLGPIPAIHSLAMSLISVTIFAGMLFSSGAEIRDTRWLLRRTRTTPIEWFLCFPLGIRPSGRVFFWSYVFYLSRFLHLLRTFFIILRHRKLSFFRLFNHSILLITSFLWLEFSQSFQVLAILFSTLVSSMVYGYRFWTETGLSQSKSFSFTANCHMLLLCCNLVCHIGVLLLHFLRGGCNGIGAWVFNSVLNAAILLFFLKSYVNFYCQRKNTSCATHGSSLDCVDDLAKHASLIAKSKT